MLKPPPQAIELNLIAGIIGQLAGIADDQTPESA